MSCTDCNGRMRRAAIAELTQIASAHGYTLWTRADADDFELLAIPSGPSHGTPQALSEALSQIRWGLPRPPRRKAIPEPKAGRHPRGNDDGMTTYRLEGTAPPLLLTFIDKLS